MRFDRHYIFRVDRYIEQMRGRLLGLDTPLSAVLGSPPDSTEQAADEVAAQLLFVLIMQNKHTTKELKAISRWLQATLLYLLNYDHEGSRTFCSLVQFLTAPLEVFLDLNIDDDTIYQRPEALTAAQLELAVITLLDANGLMEGREKLLETTNTGSE